MYVSSNKIRCESGCAFYYFDKKIDAIRFVRNTHTNGWTMRMLPWGTLQCARICITMALPQIWFHLSDIIYYVLDYAWLVVNVMARWMIVAVCTMCAHMCTVNLLSKEIRIWYAHSTFVYVFNSINMKIYDMLRWMDAVEKCVAEPFLKCLNPNRSDFTHLPRLCKRWWERSYFILIRSSFAILIEWCWWWAM